MHVTAKLELAYLGFEVSDIPSWHSLLTEVIGFTANGKNPDGSSCYRMDDFDQRLFLCEGPEEDVVAAGYVACNRDEYDALRRRVDGAGVKVHVATPGEAASRRVNELFRFQDPWGNPIEICLGQHTAPTPFASSVARSGFVTGDMGMGHIVFIVPEYEKAVRFYTDVVGMSLTDTGSENWGGVKPVIAFLHCNRRHHSLALAADVPIPKRTLHFEVHVPTVDDVGLAYDRAQAAGVEITHRLGRHPDGVFSFYGRTPSGFEWEVGTDGFEAHDAWRVKHFTRFSVWGHQTPG
jgi:2,3-dihydroxybiphenyl 1,2-dioxygenase